MTNRERCHFPKARLAAGFFYLAEAYRARRERKKSSRLAVQLSIMIRYLLLLAGLMLSAKVQAQNLSSGETLLAWPSAEAQAEIDTLRPLLLGDSCAAQSTYYQLNGRIVSGAAVLSNGSGIDTIAQLLDTGDDTVSIGSILIQLVHVKAGSNTGLFQVSIYRENDLQNALATSLPVPTALLNDTSGPSIFNDFFLNNPLEISGRFWVAINTHDNGDSIYLASTGDDCGNRSAIFQNAQQWRYFSDEFTTAASDPLDIALGIWAVIERPVSLNQPVSLSTAVFPNPSSSGVFRMKLARAFSGGRLVVMDASGRYLLSRWLGKLENDELDLSHLEQGIYSLVIENPAGRPVIVENLVIAH